jgi:uroporphyrinogen-III synthase
VKPPRVLLTRQPEQSAALREGLRELGCEVVEVPLIAIVPPAEPGPLDAALRELHRYDWVAFTSANAVQAVAERLAALGVAWPPAAQAASVGPSTRAALAERLPAATVALEPESDHRAEGLLRAFEGHRLEGRRVLLPASERARDVLARGLRERGAEVMVVAAYGNVAPPDLPARLAAALDGRIDLVTFASPSAVEGFVAAAPPRPWPPAAVIGPVTEQAARAAGFVIAAQAAPSTAAGLAAAVRGWMGLPDPDLTAGR